MTPLLCVSPQLPHLVAQHTGDNWQRGGHAAQPTPCANQPSGLGTPEMQLPLKKQAPRTRGCRSLTCASCLGQTYQRHPPPPLNTVELGVTAPQACSQVHGEDPGDYAAVHTCPSNDTHETRLLFAAQAWRTAPGSSTSLRFFFPNPSTVNVEKGCMCLSTVSQATQKGHGRSCA